eukprot:symbB.v1.2.003540.t2/scaffold196.1/size274459/12
MTVHEASRAKKAIDRNRKAIENRIRYFQKEEEKIWRDLEEVRRQAATIEEGRSRTIEKKLADRAIQQEKDLTLQHNRVKVSHNRVSVSDYRKQQQFEAMREKQLAAQAQRETSQAILHQKRQLDLEMRKQNSERAAMIQIAQKEARSRASQERSLRLERMREFQEFERQQAEQEVFFNSGENLAFLREKNLFNSHFWIKKSRKSDSTFPIKTFGLCAMEPPLKRRDRGETAVYIGEEGSLAHVAIGRFFNHLPNFKQKGVKSFAAAFKAVERGEAMYGVVPIENSASGTLHSTYDLLLQHDVVIAGELGVQEVYCLCGRPDVTLGDVRYVLSHPNILGACSAFLETRIPAGSPHALAPLEMISTISTTEAARKVSNGGFALGAACAIATKEAAVKHQLSVLAEDIGNDAFLETRYILFHLRNGEAPGAIFKLLACWALRNIDVLKVETRPLALGLRAPPNLAKARLWDYLFYVDYAVPTEEINEARLWDALGEFSLWHRDFGAYSSQVTRAEKTPQEWSDMIDLMTKS